MAIITFDAPFDVRPDTGEADPNPVVKYPPTLWKGEDFTGHRFSECSRDFLLALSRSELGIAMSLERTGGRDTSVLLCRRKARLAQRWAARVGGNL